MAQGAIVWAVHCWSHLNAPLTSIHNGWSGGRGIIASPCLWSPQTSSHHQSPLYTPNIAALLFSLWCGDTNSTYPPFKLYFGPNTAEEMICVFESTRFNHIKSPGNKSGGWQHQTNTLISHCFLLYLVEDEGGVVYSGISHTVKAKGTYRLAHSAGVQTSRTVCGQSQ